jgi:endonuclease/exonuclease/phosphatase family metal-dependent hydrolase
MTIGLRVATWNLHGFVGRRGSFDPERSLAVIGDLDVDVLALQEVNSRDPRSRGIDTFEFLRTRSGRESFEARSAGAVQGHFGQMVLSRWPIIEGQIHDVSVAWREPRMLVELALATPAGRVRVIAAHLGLGVLERRGQILALHRILAKESPGPTVVLGDFNEVRRRGLAQRLLTPEFTASGPHLTFPAHRPLLPLDRIWTAAPLVMQRSWVHRAAREASDHLPLVAELTCSPATVMAGTSSAGGVSRGG